jgi:hypothetical protein
MARPGCKPVLRSPLHATAPRCLQSGMRPLTRRPLRAATLLALGLLVLIAVGFGVAGRVFGREPPPAWVCDDTRHTQLVPRGRDVVGRPVSPPPGCAP